MACAAPVALRPCRDRDWRWPPPPASLVAHISTAPSARPSPHWAKATAGALTLASVLAVLVMLALAVGPRTGRYQTLTMLTGSMAPSLPTGSVVVVTPQPVDHLRVGQVITYQAPTEDRRVVTHRVMSVDRSGSKAVITTKGDANAGIDPWQATLEDGTVWRVRGAVPHLGRAIVALREPSVQLALSKVVPGVLLVWLLCAVWRSGDEAA